MKILLYSSVFWPSTGGVETITATLAENIVRLGHECLVVTETLAKSDEEPRIYKVIRKPKLKERFELTRQCDLVHSNGASVAMFPFAKLNNKPFIWTHNGYQVSCIDGLGWVDGEPAPITPLASINYHWQKNGLIYVLKESVKLYIRRYVADNVDLNIACSNWVAKRQTCKNQVVAHTPYSLNKFKAAKNIQNHQYDFIYVGRLVSEKGVPDLIRAFHLLISEPIHSTKTLAIVGDGNIRHSLEKLVQQLSLTNNVFFFGSKSGQELVEIIGKSHIAVVPSVWEEPFGGVTLELLAAGKNMIVSEFGGHAECVGEAGLKFKNGDDRGLYECMIKLIKDSSLAEKQLESAAFQLDAFDEVKLTKRYIELYEEVITKKSN
ncbi:glycosyltransferase family 4 protein [Aerosakkonema funiforme]|uniref:glycosyltransferase family 4 protein n=1 Tax=Aerosakkonema funiforme TaxID=1246630 RepID=UPI0035BAB6F7